MKTIIFGLIISIITTSLCSPALASESPDVTIHNYVRAEHDKDGSVSLEFGVDPDQSNHLDIVPEWSYGVRVYLPRKEIIDGS